MVGQAVLALREKIIKGKAPGIAKQSELFTDQLGHTRSPIGLPVPAVISKLPEAEKLNALLQELAWEAVTGHPLSGVKAAAAALPAK